MDRIGPFRLLAELGTGGMGRVVLAEAETAWGEVPAGGRVALKVLHPHLLDAPEFAERFAREARIGKAVRHRNVVRTYDVVPLEVDGRSQPVLVLEHVEGQTLRDMLGELGRLPEPLCRRVGRDASRGLAAIHAAGAVHRDVKPENLILTPEHDVKVMDLGVARLADGALRLSRTGQFLGSVPYAAPEAIRASGETLDGRADLHALGAVLYEAATGVHPFGDHDVAVLLRRILGERPRRAGSVNPQLSPFFEEVVHALLEKDPADRFPSAEALGRVLEEGEGSGWWAQRAAALRRGTARPLRRVRLPRETSLVGRAQETERLEALFAEAKAGRGRVVLLEGEAGVGKTRLVDEVVGRLLEQGEDLDFLFGAHSPGGAATAAGALVAAFRERFGEGPPEDGLASVLRDLPGLLPAFAALVRGRPAPPGAEPLTRESIATAFVTALRALAATRPTVLLVDDLHFATEEGRALFASLALAVPGHRILLVGTTRPGLAPDWLAQMEGLRHAGRLTLARLGPADMVRLLGEALGSERLGQELGLKVLEKSDGNPFFAFEILRGLREGHWLERTPDGRWVTTRVIADIRVPTAVQDLVHARVAALPDEDREILDVAACAGFEFEAEVVAAVLDRPPVPVLRRLAHVERRDRLVRSVGRRFRFDHHQVQECLHAGLPEALREAYHAALAGILEQRGAEGAAAAAVCEHALAGGRADLARRTLRPALAHLAELEMHEAAAALAGRALGTPGVLAGGERLPMLLRRAEDLLLLGRIAEAEAVLREGVEVAERAGDRRGAGHVERARGTACLRRGRPEEAKACLDRALALAQESGDRAGEERALGGLGSLAYAVGRLAEARRLHEAQLALARELGSPIEEAHALASLGNVAFASGMDEEAVAAHGRALEAYRQAGHARGEGGELANLGLVARSRGRLLEARERFLEALAILRGIGDRRAQALTLGNLGNVWLDLGRLDEAEECQRGLAALSEEMGDPLGAAFGAGNLGAVLQARGRTAEAQERFDWMRSVARRLGERWGEAEALLALGRLARQAGAREEAHARFDEAVAIGSEAGLPGVLLRARAYLAQRSEADRSAARMAIGRHAARAGLAERMEALHVVAEATGDEALRREAARAWEELLAHAPPDCRTSMRENVPLHRAVAASVGNERV